MLRTRSHFCVLFRRALLKMWWAKQLKLYILYNAIRRNGKTVQIYISHFPLIECRVNILFQGPTSHISHFTSHRQPHFHQSFTDQPHAHFLFTAFHSPNRTSRGNTRRKLQLLVKLPKDEFRSNQQPWSCADDQQKEYAESENSRKPIPENTPVDTCSSQNAHIFEKTFIPLICTRSFHTAQQQRPHDLLNLASSPRCIKDRPGSSLLAPLPLHSTHSPTALHNQLRLTIPSASGVGRRNWE
jgi:hypothetical protein